jgi:hypothetical protein
MDGCWIVKDRFKYAAFYFQSGSVRPADAHFERNAVIIKCETVH